MDENTPTTDPVSENCQKNTPITARVQGAIGFLEKKEIKGVNENAFRENGVSHATGYRILKSSNPRKLKNDPTRNETRGRKKVITPEQIRRMEIILENEGLEGRGLTWEQLGMEAGIKATKLTIKNTMGSLDYQKCLACQRVWQSPRNCANRMEYARIMLEKYPEPEDWDRVRWSDEVNFGWGAQHQLRITRKPGERYCVDCAQHREEPKAKDEKRFQCWAAVGYNFKSDIIFYDVPRKTNGKISHRVYRDQILEPVVKPWLVAGHDFVLEEDGDSGYGKAKTRNIVRLWKEEKKLQYFFNCASSPDLSPIENCWQPPKQHLAKYPHWDDRTTKELILEGWAQVSQDFINEKCRSIPKRLRDVLVGEGKMTGH